MNCYREPIGCGREITDSDLLNWDGLTLREFQISGLWPDDYDWNDEAPF